MMKCNCWAFVDNDGYNKIHYCHLHGAAPDMLEALKMASAYLDGPRLAQVNAAIAKAQGET